MLLTSPRKSSNKKLAAIVTTSCVIQAHTRRDLPICCHMKGHLQLLKLWYSVIYEKYNMHRLMFSLPMHYNIWQPYKFCAILMRRKFYPLPTPV